MRYAQCAAGKMTVRMIMMLTVCAGGPNGSLSLSEGQKNFIRYGACDKSFLGKVRAPLPEER